MIKAVIFDMDGVVADTETAAFMADCRVLKSIGAVKSEKDCPRTAGLPARQIYSRMLSERKINADVNEILRKRELEIEKALSSRRLAPSSGFSELLRKLKGKGYKAGLASSASRRTIDNVLAALKLKNAFSIIVSADDVDMNKPAPDVYIEAARRLNMSPDECVAIEDSETGVASAKSAGLKCIALRTEKTAGHDLSAADAVVNSLRDIKVEALDRI